MTITADQIRRIHVLKGKAGLNDAMYRAALQARGVASSKDMTAEQAADFIQALERLPQAPSKGSSKTVDGQYGKILQALWISAWNLGIVRKRDDAALIAFVERQTKLPHTRFLRDPTDARKAIEALKSWVAREGGVEWPAKRDGEGMASKRAVIEAQWRQLIKLGAVTYGPSGRDPMADLPAYVASITRGDSRRLAALDCTTVTSAELDKAATALGWKLRKARASQGTGQ